MCQSSFESSTNAADRSSAKVLQLRRSGSMVAGVCSGIAHYLGVDATLVRLGVTVLSLTSAWVVPMYITLAFVLPADQSAADLTDERPLFDGQALIQQLKCGFKDMLKATADRNSVAFQRAWDHQVDQCRRAWANAVNR